MQVHTRLLLTDPSYARARVASENGCFLVQNNQRPLTRSGTTRIPVVVHVVHNTSAEDISDEQIKSQLDVLCRDFRMTNPDVTSVPPPYSGLAADARIEFELASTDPDGDATDGITRTATTRSSFTAEDEMKSTATGGADPWPADRYLNIWVVPRLTSPIGDLLGYAQFPGGPAETDGVVITHSAFGTTGTARAPFNLGRTATHEVGHWLNLRHIWGDDDNGCSGDDFVGDTPNQGGPNGGVPIFPHVTCGNGPFGDLFMNYMDYVDDEAMFMFTLGQVVRMQACLENDRSSIGLVDDSTITPSGAGGSTLKFRDDFPRSKFLDDFFWPLSVMLPRAAEVGGPAPAHGPGPAPFVLSTPQHSMAWLRSAPEPIQQLVAAAQEAVQRYEAALGTYAEADAAGRLSPEERQRAEALYGEYMALVQHLRVSLGV